MEVEQDHMGVSDGYGVITKSWQLKDHFEMSV